MMMMMNGSFKNVFPAFAFVLVFFGCLTAFSEEEYIIADLLDLDTIRMEEQLAEDAEVARIYIFLAVWNGSQYDTYTTDGKSDLDSDGEKASEEPNDLEGYHNDTYPIEMDKAMNIEDDDYTCYITGLPNFEEIFPDDEYPFADEVLIDVHTSTTLEDDARMVGSKSVPVVTNMGEREGIDRFIAFYNKRGEDGSEDDKNDVVSFGFIEVQMLNN